MSPTVKAALAHFARLALLGAGVALVAGLIALLGSVNIASLPATYIVFASMLVPMAIQALKQAETELEAELQAEEDNKALINANNELTATKRELATLKVQMAVVEPMGNAEPTEKPTT